MLYRVQGTKEIGDLFSRDITIIVRGGGGRREGLKEAEGLVCRERRVWFRGSVAFGLEGAESLVWRERRVWFGGSGGLGLERAEGWVWHEQRVWFGGSGEFGLEGS